MLNRKIKHGFLASCITSSLFLSYTHVWEICHLSLEISSQTLTQSNRGDFHLASDDKHHVDPPNRNRGDRDTVTGETGDETLQGLHRA